MLKKFQDPQVHLKRYFERSQFSILGYRILGYRQANYKELKNVRRIYQHFFPDGNTESTALTFRPKHIFDIDEKKEEPKATSDEIYRNFFFDEVKRDNVSELQGHCKRLFKHLVCITNKRLASCGDYYEQVNSAIVLFTSEFLHWLKRLSNITKYDKDTYKEVLTRIKYLERILAENVFPDETKNTDYAIPKTIIYIIRILEKTMIPAIEWSIKQNSAREYFNALKTCTENYVCGTVNALFYLYTDTPEACIFDFTQYKEQLRTCPTVQKAIGNTRFGGLISALGSLHNALSPNSSQGQEHQLISVNPFLNQIGEASTETLNNLKKDDLPRSGIYQIMKKDELLNELIKQFGYLNDCSLFLQSFRYAYSLSGKVGDMLYLALAGEIYALLSIYLQLTAKQQKSIEQILDRTTEIFEYSTIEVSHQKWRQNFLRFKDTIRDANAFLKRSRSLLQKLARAMEITHTCEFRNEVIKEMQEFQEIVRQISERSLGICNTTIFTLQSITHPERQQQIQTLARPVLQNADSLPRTSRMIVEELDDVPSVTEAQEASLLRDIPLEESESTMLQSSSSLVRTADINTPRTPEKKHKHPGDTKRRISSSEYKALLKAVDKRLEDVRREKDKEQTSEQQSQHLDYQQIEYRQT